MIKRARPPGQPQKSLDRGSSNYRFHAMTMRALLQLLFLACLAFLLFRADLVRRRSPKVQLALFSVRRPSLLAVEAGGSQGWHRYVGDRGDVIRVDRFGPSAPGPVAMGECGFSIKNMCRRMLASLERKNA